MRGYHGARKWIFMFSVFLLAPWIGTFVWIQISGTIPEADSEQENGAEAAEYGFDLTELEEAAAAENRIGTDGQMSVEQNAASVAVRDRSIVISRTDQNFYRKLEDYLPGVVASQMPDDIDGKEFLPEVWKCQAIIARTYICNLMQGRVQIQEEELDLDYPGSVQELSGQKRSLAVRKLELAEEAVKATTGLVIKYGDNYILPMFHKISAGRTRSGGAEFPYLQSVECSQDTRRTEYLKTFAFSKDEFAARVSRVTDAAPVTAGQLPGEIQTVRKDEAGYMEEVKIGVNSYSGDEIRYSLGLPSSHFSLEADGDSIKVIVRGCGHGYGFSQAGADSLAGEGWGYEEILSLFYKNIMIISE